MAPRGIAESVTTRAGNTFTRQVLRSGQTVYRKNGKFTSARAYTSARASRGATDPVPGFLKRAPAPGEFRPRKVDFIRADDTAGDLASTVLPYLSPGDPLTREEIRILANESRMERSFNGFWQNPVNENLTRAEAEERFLQFIQALEGARSAAERNLIRVQFGLGRYEVGSFEDLDDAA